MIINNSILKISHHKTAGFFSNCTVRLNAIIKYVNINNVLPNFIDSSLQFRNYKEDENYTKEDLSKYFFQENSEYQKISKTNFATNEQFKKYKNLDFKNITPYIEKFFTPSRPIKNIIQTLETKYSINYENICSVYYRGNDKSKETNLASYEDFFAKAEEILLTNNNLTFLIQTDETEFAETFKKKFPNSFVFEEIHMINRNAESSVHHSLPRNKRKEHAAYFLAATIIIAKTKHLITYSGNCGLWALLYRGHAKNIYQYLNRIDPRVPEKNVCGWH